LVDGRQMMADADRGPPCEWKTSQKAQDRLVTTHDLGVLLNDLRDALAALNYGPVPPPLIEISDELAKVEAGEAARLRYPTLGPRRGPRAESFPKQVVLPVGRIQELLRATIALYKTSEDNPSSSLSFLIDLYYESQAQAQVLYELGLL